MRLLWLSLVLGLFAACETPPEQERRDVCTAFCDCATTTPLALERCITDDCLPDVPAVSDDCLTCVYTSSQTCGDLYDDCFAMCFPQNLP